MKTKVVTTDSSLVLASLSGDKEAFVLLLERHRPLLFALSRRMLGDFGLAEEAVQEASLQAMLNLDRLRKPDRFGAWLAGIGLNICRRWLEERARDCWSWEAIAGGRATAGDAQEATPQDLAEQQELSERVRRAVSLLPPGQRSAVVLFYLAGLTGEETAAALGIELGTLKTRLYKARGNLRKQLWDLWKEEEMATSTESGGVPVRIANVYKKPTDEYPQYILVLEEIEGDRTVRIWVGPAEATAIALHLANIVPPRPMTFAFMARVLEATGARLGEVRITRLTDDTFYASAVVEGRDGIRTVDARPSDALALALCVGVPIFVEPQVFEAAHGWERAHPEESRGSLEDLPGKSEIAAELTSRWPGFRKE